MPRHRNGLQTRLLPFSIYLLLVYAFQMSYYFKAFAHYSVRIGFGAQAEQALQYQQQTAAVGRRTVRTMSTVMAAPNEHEYMNRTLACFHLRVDTLPSLKDIMVVDDDIDPPLANIMGCYPQI